MPCVLGAGFPGRPALRSAGFRQPADRDRQVVLAELLKVWQSTRAAAGISQSLHF